MSKSSMQKAARSAMCASLARARSSRNQSGGGVWWGGMARRAPTLTHYPLTHSKSMIEIEIDHKGKAVFACFLDHSKGKEGR